MSQKEAKMDRDPRANVTDAEDHSGTTTGASDYGESGAQRAREAKEREPERKVRAPQTPPPPD